MASSQYGLAWETQVLPSPCTDSNARPGQEGTGTLVAALTLFLWGRYLVICAGQWTGKMSPHWPVYVPYGSRLHRTVRKETIPLDRSLESALPFDVSRWLCTGEWEAPSACPAPDEHTLSQAGTQSLCGWQCVWAGCQEATALGRGRRGGHSPGNAHSSQISHGLGAYVWGELFIQLLLCAHKWSPPWGT